MSHPPLIAVVNDDAAFIDLMSELLEAEGGYKTLTLHEGDKAYKTIKAKKPSAVILDIRMQSPETGWTVLELLSLDPETRRIPVIICTAATLDADKKQWLTQHGISLLPKPFDIDDMLTIVRDKLASAGE